MAIPTDAALAPHDRAFFGHPRGLSTLFFTEMWERFSYYGMRALLILFMTAPLSRRRAGLRHRDRRRDLRPLHLDGLHDQLPGGWIADRLIGQRRAVLYGGILIACGHFSMAVPVADDLLPRPLPDRPRHRPAQGQRQRHRRPAVRPRTIVRRDAGFSIFYMGINLGAFIAPLVCGYLGQRVNWHARLRRGRRRHGARRRSSTSLGAQVSRRRRAAAGRRPHRRRRTAAPSAGARSGASCSPSRSSSSSASASTPACCRSPPTQVADAAGYLLLVTHRRVLRLAVLRRRLDARRAQAALRHRRVVPRGGAVLVGVRAGRLDAQPVRRPQHPQRRSLGWEFPSSWFQSLQLAVHHHARAGVRVALAAARPRGRSRRARPSSRSA